MKIHLRHTMTKTHAVILASSFFALILIFEALCAFKLGITRRDVVTATLVVTAWFRDVGLVVLEKLGVFELV